MLTACACIHEVCVRIQLDCVCRPYVCARILVPRNPSLNLFASISLFKYASVLVCSHMYMSMFLCLLVVCSPYVRLGFRFNSFFVLP